MSFPKQSLLAMLLVFSAFCRAEVIRIFPQGDPDAVIADGSVKRSMILRGKGTQSMEKEPGEAKFSFMRIAAAPGEKRCQAMANLRPAVSVGGTELHFSAQVRGSGKFDVGIVAQLNGGEQGGTFSKPLALKNQWQEVSFRLDMTNRTPDQLLFWLRVFGENARLDIRAFKLELRGDDRVAITVPADCPVVSAGQGVLPEIRIPVRGSFASANAAYTSPDGKRHRLALKNQGGTLLIKDVKAMPGVYRFAVGAAGHSVTFHVLALDDKDLEAYRRASAALDPGRPLNILLLGDSLSDFRRGSNWADILQGMLRARHPSSRIFNYACRGDSVNHVCKRLCGRGDVSFAGHYQGISDNPYDLVIIFLGQNDTVTDKTSGFTKPAIGIDREEKLYRQLFDVLKNITPAPVVIFSAVSTPQEVCAANAKKHGYRFGVPALVEAYDKLVEKLCAEYNHTYWDIYTPLSKLPDKAAYFQNDGVHLNDKGNFFTALFAAEKLSALPLSVRKQIASAPQWRVDAPTPGVWILRNENAEWKGINVKGVVPQSGPHLVVRKVFDLTRLPPEARRGAKKVFLRIFFGILDYSIETKKGFPGLTEKLFIRLNGETTEYATADPRFPSTSDPRKKRRQEWCDIPIPVKFLQGGDTLTVDFGKVDRGDDFLYPSFDGSRPAKASFVSYDGGRNYSRIWQKAPLGELMMRLVVDAGRPEMTAVFTPGKDKGTVAGKGFSFVESKENSLRIELAPDAIDFASPVKVEVACSGGKSPAVSLMFYGGEGQVPQKTSPTPDGVSCDISRQGTPFAVFIDKNGAEVRSVTMKFLPALESSRPVNLNPKMAAPAGKRVSGSAVTLGNGKAVISTPALEMVFAVSPKLALKKITARDIGRQILRRGGGDALFKLRSNGKIFTAADAVNVRAVKSTGAVRFDFDLPGAGCSGSLTCRIAGEEIGWQLKFTNGGKPGELTAAFPYLEGIELGDKPEEDYYFFPCGGGIIADRNTILRSGYGMNDAWWQIVDLFSPKLGGGFAMRIADTDNTVKAFNLCKGRESELVYRRIYPARPGKVDYGIMLPDCLPPGDGIGMAVDYQRKKVSAGAEMPLPEALFSSHPGNWKVPMGNYAAWAHKVWQFRPKNGRIQKLWNLHAGMGVGSPLWVDGKYHERYVSPNTTFLELNSYWSVDPLAPWDTPIDRIAELGPTAVRQRARHFGYWVDPADGKEKHSYNRGDYDGYNPQWGGLPTLRAHIDKLHGYGKKVIFYTDPIIVDPNTKLGRSKGEVWGVVNPAWQDPYNCLKNPKDLLAQGHVFHYFSYCMCLNNPEYIRWVAENMARMIRETGIDGIRLDEFGHGGYICLSKKHRHLYPGDGENVWLKAIKTCVEEIRKETDKFDKDVILMGEYQGTDATGAVFDGALSYDVCRNTFPLHPLAVNLFRFYFPECKLFELDESNKNTRKDIWLFNGVGVYNSSLYPPAYHDVLKKYTDAFSGSGEPLVDTLIDYVYANRFTSDDGKLVVHTVYNMTGHTVDEPLLEVTAESGWTFADGFTGKEIVPVNLADGRRAVRARVESNRVMVLVQKRR